MNPALPDVVPHPPPGRLRRAAPSLGSFFIVVLTTTLIADQVTSRDDFANSELADDVQARWGAPVNQPAPSVRAVESGSIFTELTPLPLDRQHVTVDASMNYRKRGLRSFSGFELAFTGRYGLVNRQGHDVDVAFVFPLEVDKAQVLMSDLQFLVDGAPAPLELGEQRNRLVWAGRLPKGASVELLIRYRARGLDTFLYRLDPALPARDVKLDVAVRGGENFDYPEGVLSATDVRSSRDGIALGWRFASLESGVSLGVTLPSRQTWDTAIATMARRAWFPYAGLAALLFALGARHRRPLAFYESLLVAALFGFAFVVLAYLAAFTTFWVAWPLTVVGLGAAFVAWLRRIFPAERPLLLAGLWAATMAVPTLAVVTQGYTGLLYTAELLAALLAAMLLSTRRAVRAWLDDSFARKGVSP